MKSKLLGLWHWLWDTTPGPTNPSGVSAVVSATNSITPTLSTNLQEDPTSKIQTGDETSDRDKRTR